MSLLPVTSQQINRTNPAKKNLPTPQNQFRKKSLYQVEVAVPLRKNLSVRDWAAK